ncbi:D-2-hydroxyacid dehydrogenase [Chitinilyticum piscinae]|uniref:D-2-hydroxyacid dehydrogenase n=1 Tax=Chitinilyticum piscinae TaxID=2866724 RepID=A0A8J7FL02_9NEIS|nr:D-2-hydroxyacid dehydrogenase [Chitinilyticum piscinae]MBE9609690.1 D-2-hydroxyacid dehydrogenase [Chitinilyticum piscinae]
MSDNAVVPEIVFLDSATLPVPLPGLSQPHRWVNYPGSTPQEALQRLGSATVCVTNKVPVTSELLDTAPSLRLVAVAATGYNNIDLDACRQRGIRVCNIRDYAVAGVPEHALMLMLVLRRQLLAYRADLAAGAWQRAQGFCHFGAPMHDLAGSTLVLLGRGALGQATARLAEAFGMRIVWAEHQGAEQIRSGYVPFAEALAQADVLSLHCPLTAQTRNLIGRDELAQLKPSCILINTSRGGLVDEIALLEALRAGRLAGAGLDVLVEEPPRAGNALLEVNLPNLLLTPHVAWASQETMSRLAGQLIDNVAAYLAGNPQNCVV